ncbi:MAG: Kef family K(+) transporter [Hyphomicrobiaceae bacterium]|nr:Kef family K(+) transporter [Hyphomicrobiaceae bacterium]
MPHHTPLIGTIVVGLVLAFLLGAVANRLRVSPLVGYLLAGVLVGPYTPGFVADQALAADLAEIGVILLMFGVGLHFSFRDLMGVRAIAVPGALAQIGAATLMGLGLSTLLGWRFGGGIVFGLALSVASTVVLLRALQERRLVTSSRGRIAVGWLVVEDIVMVLTLVLLPALAPYLDTSGDIVPGFAPRPSDIALALAMTVLKISAFFLVMLIVGRRYIPWVLHHVAHSGSRELFRLSVLAIALGVAYGAAELFGVSFALGAFFAGMILSESELSQQAAAESLPLRDAFAVLFFVSVGMLFDPSILLREALPVAATVLIIVVGKSMAALAIVLAFRYPFGTALTVAVSLAQIGEFSFILAGLGVNLGLLPERGRDLVLAGALLSIMLNPLLFAGLEWLKPWIERREAAAGDTQQRDTEPEAGAPAVTTLSGHNVLIGAGRVGARVAEALQRSAAPLLVIDEKEETAAKLRSNGMEVMAGNAMLILKSANLPEARMLLVAIPDTFEAGQIIAQARAMNPELQIFARAHSDAEADHLRSYGASGVVLGEQEIATAMIEQFARAEAELSRSAKDA